MFSFVFTKFKFQLTLKAHRICLGTKTRPTCFAPVKCKIRSSGAARWWFDDFVWMRVERLFRSLAGSCQKTTLLARILEAFYSQLPHALSLIGAFKIVLASELVHLGECLGTQLSEVSLSGCISKIIKHAILLCSWSFQRNSAGLKLGRYPRPPIPCPHTHRIFNYRKGHNMKTVNS